MEINSSQAEKKCVLEISGRIDSRTSPELELQLKAALDSQPQGLVLDFGAVEFLSSAGLRVLISAAKRCRSQNTGLALHSISSNLAEILELAGLRGYLPVHHDRESALFSLNRA